MIYNISEIKEDLIEKKQKKMCSLNNDNFNCLDVIKGQPYYLTFGEI
jgi:hypothetical protein